MRFLTTNGRGLLLCLAVAVPSWILGNLFPIVGGAVIAILIGMIIAVFLKDQGPMAPGIKFTSKKILQWAVILLGFGLDLTVVLQTGKQSLPIIVCTIAVSLLIAFFLSKALKMPSKIATLIGVGSSICGGSAIAATAPVINADDEEVAQSISVIFFFNVLAAILFPILGNLIGFSTTSGEAFGIFAGTAVNDTSSVTAAAAAWDGMHPGANTLDAATIVKLTRTLAIIPITLALAFWQMRQERRTGAEAASTFSLRRAFPTFVGLFVLASLATTLLALPAAVTAPLKDLSKFLIIMAMSAIGFNTNIVKLVRGGAKPTALGACCWMAIALVSLGMQHVIGIW